MGPHGKHTHLSIDQSTGNAFGAHREGLEGLRRNAPAPRSSPHLVRPDVLSGRITVGHGKVAGRALQRINACQADAHTRVHGTAPFRMTTGCRLTELGESVEQISIEVELMGQVPPYPPAGSSVPRGNQGRCDLWWVRKTSLLSFWYCGRLLTCTRDLTHQRRRILPFQRDNISGNLMVSMLVLGARLAYYNLKSTS